MSTPTAERFGVLGRRTIRKSGGRQTRLWEHGKSKNATVKKLEVAYLDGLGVVDRTEARHEVNKADTRFTPDGVRDDLVKHVLADAVPALHRGRLAIRKAKLEVAERKSKLKLDSPPKDDVAAAFRRMEIRTHLKDMSTDQQSKYFAKYEANMPVEIMQAVTELPAEYSGIPQSRYDLLVNGQMEANFGPEIAEISEIEQAIEAAESTVEAARFEVAREAGIVEMAKFEELAAPIEAREQVPWLRGGRVVDLERGVERAPTADELANGIEAATLEEFNIRKAA
jgi:hypothetical protein